MPRSIILTEQQQVRDVGRALEYMLDEEGSIRHTFWGLLRYLQMHHSCYMPGPAVFANQDARWIINALTDDQAAVDGSIPFIRSSKKPLVYVHKGLFLITMDISLFT